MNFEELITRVNNEEVDKREVIDDIVAKIDINETNFNVWVDKVFSEDVDKFDMSKLPYLIDELYQGNNKFKFMLCCMLIEVTCDKLEFITNLEDYQLFEVKFETLLNTLVTVYDYVDNGIANCMALILLNNDPKLTRLNDEQKNTLVCATKRKLNDILDYLHTEDINPLVYKDLEVIVDLACYLNNSDINDLISKIDELENNEDADIFIIKYKLINNMDLIDSKLNRLKIDNERVFTLYHIMEELGVQNKYLADVPQEAIARSDMVRWLSYPTELGSAPDKIELLGEFTFNNQKCYAYKYMKEGFTKEGELLGVSGGYPFDKVTATPSGYTFSKFENVEDDWNKQALELVKFIYDYWVERSKK